VLIAVAAIALIADLAFMILAPEGRGFNLVLAALLGGSIYAMYPVIVAHANDHAEPGTAIQISGGLLLMYGVGSIIGPLVAGFAMSGVGIRALFLVTSCAHVMVIGYTIWRMRKRDSVPDADKSNFQPATAGRTSTLQTVVHSSSVVRPQDQVRSIREATGKKPK
jgi:fucose permease